MANDIIEGLKMKPPADPRQKTYELVTVVIVVTAGVTEVSATETCASLVFSKSLHAT